MTVTTDHLTLGNFSLNGIQRPALFGHSENTTPLDAAYMIEVENAYVGVTTINARMNSKVIVKKLSTFCCKLRDVIS